MPRFKYSLDSKNKAYNTHTSNNTQNLIKQNKKDIRIIKLFAARLIVFFVVLYILFGIVFNIKIVPDLSMKPKLMAGDLSIVYKLDRKFNPGTVVFYNADGKLRVGRIVAVGGDTVEIKDKMVFINNSVVMDGDIYYSTDPLEEKVSYPLTLKSNEYFILGDMREGAKDSRYFGAVNADDILGKVVTVIRKNEI